MNAAAHERARYYVSQYGSAFAALEVVNQPGHNDAFDRAVCEELRQIQYAEHKAAQK